MRKKSEYVGAYYRPNVMIHKLPDQTNEYAVHEVLFNESHRPISWDRDAQSPRMPSVQALKEELNRLLMAAKLSDMDKAYDIFGNEYTYADISYWLEYIDVEPLPFDIYYSDEQVARNFQEITTISTEPRVLLHQTSDGSDEYAIHDVYYNVFGTIYNWTDNALSSRMPTIPALREEILRLIQESQPPKYRITCGDKNLSYRLDEVQSWLEATEKEPL